MHQRQSRLDTVASRHSWEFSVRHCTASVDAVVKQEQDHESSSVECDAANYAIHERTAISSKNLTLAAVCQIDY